MNRIADELRAGDFVSPSVRLVSKIAQGGMGTVWLAEHLVLDTRVVVKLMAREVQDRPEVLARFSREAMIAAQVKSPHVVQVLDSGTTEAGIPFIVMELLEGHDLDKHLARGGPMTPQALCPILVQVAKALTKAHRVGVVHRDIKPENIFLCDTDAASEPFVKLLDFGTAKADLARDRNMGSTDTGEVLGTPFYMSPEQIVGDKELDLRTDIWSFGVVAFEALTGKVPFEGATMAALALAIHGELPRLTDLRPDLPPALDAWFARVCAREPSARYATVREAADAFVRAALGVPLLEPFESVRAPRVDVMGAPEAPPPPPVGFAPASQRSEPPVPLTRTLPAAGSERRSVNIAFGVVAALAAAVALVVVIRSSPRAPAEDPSPTEAAAAASTPSASVPPEPSPAPAAPEDEPAEEPAVVAHVERPAPPPKPNPPMTHGPRAKSRGTVRPARADRTASSPVTSANRTVGSEAASATAGDEDLERLASIDAGGVAPAEPTPAAVAPPAEVAPSEASPPAGSGAEALPAERAPAPPPALEALPSSD